jgi:hypothetical protein
MIAPSREIDLLIPVMILMEQVAINASFHHREMGMASRQAASVVVRRRPRHQSSWRQVALGTRLDMTRLGTQNKVPDSLHPTPFLATT